MSPPGQAIWEPVCHLHTFCPIQWQTQMSLVKKWNHLMGAAWTPGSPDRGGRAYMHHSLCVEDMNFCSFKPLQVCRCCLLHQLALTLFDLCTAANFVARHI